MKDFLMRQNKSERMEKKELNTVYLSFFMLFIYLLPCLSYGQETKKQDTSRIVPDGTEGLTLTKRDPDSITKKLPPNEFKGPYSTFRIGFGYIFDATTYAQDDVFKKQMDSANLDVYPNGKTRDFRILGS